MIVGHVNKGKSNWWSKKPISKVNVWHCRSLSRTVHFKSNKKKCSLSNLNNCSKRIDVHHKDKNIRNISINNLVTLCARHHKLVEMGYIDFKKPKNPPFHKYPNGRIIYPKNKQYKKIYGGNDE